MHENKKRELEICVISDLHLGTYGCHADDLLHYLNGIQPEILILNGDIIDIWNFRKSFFPNSHLKVLNKILIMAQEGVKVYYLTGNHDELLRRFGKQELGNITLANKLIIHRNGKTMWFFHGDIFDASIQNAKWLAKLGGWGYDLLIMINRWLNWGLELFGRERYSLSKKIKNSVKKAVKYVTDFENTAAELAIDQGFDIVACGHIHQPQIRKITNKRGNTLYLNSGDWVENLSSLEYLNESWQIHLERAGSHPKESSQQDHLDLKEKELLRLILNERLGQVVLS